MSHKRDIVYTVSWNNFAHKNYINCTDKLQQAIYMPQKIQ